MALTFPRWLIAAVALAGVAALAILRDLHEPHLLPVDGYRERETRAGSHASVWWERLRVEQLLDSIHRSRSTPGTRQSTFTVAARTSVPLATAMGQLVDAIAETRPTTPKIPVDVVALVDSLPSPVSAARYAYGSLRADYVLPADANGRCTVLLRLPPGRFSPSWVQSRRGSRLLGPCGFYEWFGVPGRAMDEWLRGRTGGWSYGLVSAWRQDAPPWTPWRFYDVNPDMDWGVDFGFRLASADVGVRCATGVARACEDALLGNAGNSEPLFRETSVWSFEGDTRNVVSPKWGLGVNEYAFLWYSSKAPLGPRGSWLLAAMAHDLGAERFQRLWSSPLPLRDAFQQASGVTLGDWVADWMRSTYGRQYRGPGAPPRSVALALIVAAVAVGYALVRASRRQVTT
ncbi:MAG TPA: hypothetical protein VJ867_13515 [Gemmatimonadaceae bacterium]|nr:hypothetical protein [Gemmatimonadaceae bacterium]